MLNERQKVLADVLLSLKGWTTRKELLKIPEIRIAYPNNSRNGIYFSANARQLTQDMQVLNESDDFPYVIVQNSYLGVKIYAGEEDDFYLNNEKFKILRALKRINQKLKKVKKSQIKIIDEGKEVNEK